MEAAIYAAMILVTALVVVTCAIYLADADRHQDDDAALYIYHQRLLNGEEVWPDASS